MPKPKKKSSGILIMISLILSGEAIFFLPFILPRVFRPTFLDVFGISNVELGTAFSAYGIVAMISYFLGGPLADRFSARGLMTVALAATAAGGLYLATIPSVIDLSLIYAFWGMTTILLFWAALIRATREWGGTSSQGIAFGLLDGGRGLGGALIGIAGIAVLSSLLPSQVEHADLLQRTQSFQKVILLFSGATFLIAVLVWVVLPGGRIAGPVDFRTSLDGVKKIFRLRAVWLQSLILLCAYVGYKITDDFSLYARDVLDFDEVSAAGAGTFALLLRPVVAIGAGFLADRFDPSRMVIVSFLFMTLGGIMAGSGLFDPGVLLPHLLTLICISIGVYALRGLYYAIMEEGKIPLALTGTAVGVVSVLGYTPDIFVGPAMGWLLDSWPGAQGHQYLFLFLALFGCIGWLAAILFRKYCTTQ